MSDPNCQPNCSPCDGLNVTVGTQVPRSSACPPQNRGDSLEYLTHVLGLDLAGKQATLRNVGNAFLITDSNGKPHFADGVGKPIKVRPVGMDSAETLDALFGLASSNGCPKPEWRTIPRDRFVELIEDAVADLVAAQVAAALADEAISAKVDALTEVYRVGDWKMRLDNLRPPNWFRSGEKFAPTVYPELFELLGSDTVPDFRGHFIRQVDFADANRPVASTGTFCPASVCADPLDDVMVSFLIYGGRPVPCA